MPTRISCPHCSVIVVYEPTVAIFGSGRAGADCSPDEDGFSGVEYQLTPCCRRYIVSISNANDRKQLIWPKVTAVQQLSERVPAKYARCYQEASAVLGVSPKASAAISRRCLQMFLTDTGANASTLEAQIQAALAGDPPIFPGGLARKFARVQTIARFDIHPEKNTHPGELLDVAPHEAVFLLDLLSEVFAHHFANAPANASGGEPGSS